MADVVEMIETAVTKSLYPHGPLFYTMESVKSIPGLLPIFSTVPYFDKNVNRVKPILLLRYLRIYLLLSELCGLEFDVEPACLARKLFFLKLLSGTFHHLQPPAFIPVQNAILHLHSHKVVVCCNKSEPAAGSVYLEVEESRRETRKELVPRVRFFTKASARCRGEVVPFRPSSGSLYGSPQALNPVRRTPSLTL